MSKNSISEKNQFEFDRIADNLEVFIEDVQNLFIFEGTTEEEIKEAIKTCKKGIKHLRNGKPEKVLDMDKYYEYKSKYGRN